MERPCRSVSPWQLAAFPTEYSLDIIFLSETLQSSAVFFQLPVYTMMCIARVAQPNITLLAPGVVICRNPQAHCLPTTPLCGDSSTRGKCCDPLVMVEKFTVHSDVCDPVHSTMVTDFLSDYISRSPPDCCIWPLVDFTLIGSRL